MKDSPRTTYTNRLVERAGEPISMHLGYWEDPTSTLDLTQAQASLDDWIVDQARVVPGQRVLDVGCGLGATLSRIDGRYPNMTLCGVNNDEAQLAIARQHTPSKDSNRFEWIMADAGDLPFPESSFDCVVSVEAAFHFSSRYAAFREMARVVRPGGRVAFTDIVPTPLLRRIQKKPLFAFLVEGVIQRGIGPFQHFWESDFSLRNHPAELGLTLEHLVDLSESTLPSYRHFLGCEILSKEQDFRQMSDMTFAVNVLGALHQAQAVKVVGGVFRKLK